MAEHLFIIAFVFVMGACIGSFLNVVVYRLPNNISLIHPPSHCPGCKTKLGLNDNIPILGWIFLKGKCRYCAKPISARYPAIEAVTGLLFVFYYVMFFIVRAGPVLDTRKAHMFVWFIGSMNSFFDQWPIYFLYMALISGLLAASLIDAELFVIPASIPWWIGGAAIVVHAIFDNPKLPGNVLISPGSMALCAGCAAGLILSIVLLQRKIIPLSFPDGNLMDHEREEMDQQPAEGKKREAGGKPQEDGEEEFPPDLTPAQVRGEIGKEVLFLFPALLAGAISIALYLHVNAYHEMFIGAAKIDWLNGAMGSLLGGLVGGFTIWVTRILGSYGFGREAMGLGDVHLMFGVGAVLGGGPAFVAFLISPFFAICWALYIFFTRSQRQLPFGPFLSLGTAFVMLFYSPIVVYYRPGLIVAIPMMVDWVKTMFGG